MFVALSGLRRLAYAKGWLPVVHPGPKVIVVGNITAGGTGKTPVVIGLVTALQNLGLTVAVISRGYGGSSQGVLRVYADSDPAVVGDEALLVARRTGAIVCVGRDRAAAAALAADTKPDVIISDDGLQHYGLARDLEIVTMDAQEGFGNGHRLPVGPLREPLARLGNIDFLLARGGQDPLSATRYEAVALRRLGGEERRPVDNPGLGPKVHALAAIARPGRFFTALRGLGFDPVEHPLPDHQSPDAVHLSALQSLPLIVTEKDAVKLAADCHLDAWVLEMGVVFPDGFIAELCRRAELEVRSS